VKCNRVATNLPKRPKHLMSDVLPPRALKHVCHPCLCVSMKPGVVILPVTSMVSVVVVVFIMVAGNGGVALAG